MQCCMSVTVTDGEDKSVFVSPCLGVHDARSSIQFFKQQPLVQVHLMHLYMGGGLQGCSFLLFS